MGRRKDPKGVAMVRLAVRRLADALPIIRSLPLPSLGGARGLGMGCGGRDRTADLLVMSQPSSLCSTPQCRAPARVFPAGASVDDVDRYGPGGLRRQYPILRSCAIIALHAVEGRRQ